MKRRLAVAALTLACMAVTSVLVTGCAYRRADRSLVQPLAFSKKQFAGEWYYMKTVYEAPYESGYFSGQGGWPLGSKMRFEITERYLYAFNAAPNIRNTESALTPVAAWPISKHFDIKARLNYSTGEPSNVIVEESMDGLPWYQRQYIRVHWESSVISDLTDIGETLTKWWYRGLFRDEPAMYVPPEKVEFHPEYMTFVVDRLVTNMIDALYNMFLSEIPASSYRIRMRHAFKKVMPSTYTPKEYNDFMLSKFGNFRTSIIQYQPDRGIVDWSYKFFASRHNVATKEELDKGSTKPKKVIYYLSPNWPEDLRDAAIQVGNDWNAAMSYALQRPAKDGNVNAVFEVLPNAWKEGVCDRAKIWDCTFEKTNVRRELGDMRHHIMWYVNEPQTGSPLGYGPSFPDPETGEIITAMAYVYGDGFRRITESYMVLYDLLSGRYTEGEIVNGVEYFNAAFGLNGYGALVGLSGDSKIKYTGIAGMPNSSPQGMIAPQLRLNNTSKLLGRLNSAEFLTRMQNVRKLDQTMITSQLAKFDANPQAKAYMMSDYVASLAFPNADSSKVLALAAEDPQIKQMINFYHPTELVKPHNLRNLLGNYISPSKFNMYMADYADPVLDSFVQYHVRKGTPRDEVRREMMRFMFIAVTAHEVGHTLGLMHNFRGSTDEFNYHNAYHDLKEGKTPTTCNIDGLNCDPAKIDTLGKDKDGNALKDPITGYPAATAWYRNASIMDYAGEMYDDHLGVGKTDRAALAFMYGGVVESAVKDPREQGQLIKWDMTVETRNQDPKDPLKLRHFRYCSDYSIGQDPFCMLWDSGPSAEGIVKQYELNYDRTYPLNYWRRGRRTFGPSNVFGRMFFRFRHIALIYQDLAHRITTQPGYEKTDAFKDQLAAVQKGFSFFMRIMTTPDVGLHTKDLIDGVWKRYPVDPDNHSTKYDVKLGEGRYFYSDLNNGYFGIFRFRRVGTLYDKWVTMMALTTRSWGYYNNSVNWLYTNYYDLFNEDVTDLFSQTIADSFDPKSPLLYRKCELDANNNCKKDAQGNMIQNPIEPAWHLFLSYFGMSYALALLNNPFHDRTFGNNMLVGLKGSGKSWTPPGMGEVKCPPINTVTNQFQCGTEANPYQMVCFNNFHNTRTYFAVQPKNGMGISYKLVSRACNLGNDLSLLRKSGASRSYIERKEGELENIETLLTIMQLYTSFFEG